MDLLDNPLIERLLGIVMDPLALSIALLVGLALCSGLVARSVEIVEERTPVRLAAGSRSPARTQSGPAG